MDLDQLRSHYGLSEEQLAAVEALVAQRVEVAVNNALLSQREETGRPQVPLQLTLNFIRQMHDPAFNSFVEHIVL
jgi:hypothetical protein